MKRMSMKLIILMSLTLLGSVAMPTFASANGLQYSGGSWNVQRSFILKVQTTERWETDRPDLGAKGIYSYGSEMFREPELFREKSSNSDMSHSDIVGPSVNIPHSVDGHTGGVDRPFFGGSQPGGDPSVQGLSRMDGGGFSSGNGGGSVPGYNGR